MRGQDSTKEPAGLDTRPEPVASCVIDINSVYQNGDALQRSVMSSVTYRRFRRSDWESVQAFLSSQGESSEHARAVLASEQVEAWLALDDDDVIGWILTHPGRSEDSTQLGFIEDIVVAQSHRRRGIGRGLMDLAEAHYRDRGCPGMQLTVRADNEAALTLYESLGYTTVQHRLRMRKQFL